MFQKMILFISSHLSSDIVALKRIQENKKILIRFEVIDGKVHC